MSVEIVTVCKLNGQWGLWLPGCREHVTRYYGKTIISKVHALYIAEVVMAAYQTEYGEPLPWQVEVIE